MKRYQNPSLSVACGLALLAGSANGHAATINVSGDLAGVNNWVAANEYVLNGYVYVLNSAVLNIEAGTVVRGKPGAAPDFGALFVCRGGKINACGTSDRPIIFTSEVDDLSDPFDIPFTAAGRKLWGGVVLLGRGLLNRADATSVNGTNPDGSKWQIYEGLPNEDKNRFGGNDNDDSSGILRYVSIRHGGISLTADKEINGLSMGAVGRGTVVEHVECYQQGDDGFEWWGGAVNSRYLVAAFVDDECFDMDEGHIGLHQFWFGIQDIASDEGMELNGQPSGGINSNTVGLEPLGKHQIYNVTLIGNKSDSGNDVMNTRSEYYGEIRNSVFEDFSGSDQVSSVANYHGVVENNHFYNNGGNGIANANNTRTSDALDPLIANETRTQDQLLDPRPLTGSPLLNSATAYPTPVNGFFCPAPYKGAFTEKENWLVGWTAVSQNQHTKARGATVVDVSGDLTGTVNWTADKTYVLNGYVYVRDGAVLNLEPGTIVRGKPGAAPDFGALFVCRGGKIYANGTPSAPIVFTSETDDLADPFDIPFTAAGRKLWGGVVLLGRGLLNRADATSVNGTNPDGSKWQIYEGLPNEDKNRFGGNNNDDSSGVLRYVSLRHGGISLSADKEINGLSLGGVGRGTIIENVECYQQGDDGFEWWGGAVNTKYLVAASCDDECFDMDEGHTGLHQFWFGLQAIASDEGMELNGQPSGGINSNTIGLQPFGKHQIYNVTLMGNKTDGGNDVLNTRSEYFGEIHNSVFEDFSGSDQVSSVANYHGVVENNHFYNNGGNGIAHANNVRTSDAIDPLIVNESKTQDRLLDPRPATGSPLYTGWRTPPVNGHFEQAAYKGAFDTDLWIAGWTALDNNNHLVGAGSSRQCPMPAPQPQVAVAGDNVTLTWTARHGLSYQVQVSSDLVTWTNVGAVQRNTGEADVAQTYNTSIAGVGTKKHFRVLASR
jgi:hypothetical protein